MSDRLDEYRRQRALLKEHLDWLDRQIAGLEGFPEVESRRPVAPPETGTGAPPPMLSSGPSDLDAESILSQYRQPEGTLQSEARRGCLFFFSIGLVLTALAVFVLYLMVRRARGH